MESHTHADRHTVKEGLVEWIQRSLSLSLLFCLLKLTFCPDLKAELQLDWLKGTRGGVKRVLFLDTQQAQRTGHLTLGHNQPRACKSYTIYLRVSKPHAYTDINVYVLHNVVKCRENNYAKLTIWIFPCYFVTLRRRMSSGTN